MADGPLYSIVEYDLGHLNVVYAGDATMHFYGDHDHLVACFDLVRSATHVELEKGKLSAEALSPLLTAYTTRPRCPGSRNSSALPTTGMASSSRSS